MKKKRTTTHARKRIDERYSDKVNADDLSRGAKHCGISYYELDDTTPNLKAFLKRKSKTGKDVKLYKGYIFIFFTTSKRLITMYRLDEAFADEYESVRYLEDEKRGIYRRSKREQQI